MNTVQPPKIAENRSDERERVALANALRDAANLRYQATFATATTLSAAPTAIWTSDDMPRNALWDVEVQVGGIATDGSAAGYRRTGRFKRGTGASSLIGVVATPFADSEDVAGWDVTLSASGNGVLLTVTGDVARTVSWEAFVTVKETRL